MAVDRENKTGFICSSFDIYHTGYSLMLKYCKDHCDYLVVGLQDDPSWQRSEKNSPVMSLHSRWLILKSISYIDEIAPYNSEEELNNYKIGDKIKVKILESKIDEQKIRVGLREALGSDPIDFFKDKKINEKITCKVISTDRKKGLIVRPIGCDMDFLIKKSSISMNAGDARPERWTEGNSVDVCIAELDMGKRKIILSIKLLEEIEKKEALEKYGAEEGSGKQLPFSSLSEDLKKKTKKDE